MNKLIKFITLGLLFSQIIPTTHADCFLAKENNKVIISKGECNTRHEPRCSFNIALSLMGFNDGVLIDETHPEFPFKTGYLDYVEKWKQPHNPSMWMKNSCLWYSQLITKKLGIEKLKKYVNEFNYGTQDVSGEKGKNNGLTRSWMSNGSLKISPEEQTVFIEKFINDKLPVSHKSIEMTKNIVFIEYLADNWKLYGKTGTGNLPKADGTLDENREGGWFVGWIEKGDRKIVFASYVEQNKQDTPAGGKAKANAKEKLAEIINGIG